MNQCECCGTTLDPALGKPAGPRRRPATKCAYCSGFPRSDRGRCWGMHGDTFTRYLNNLVDFGKLPATAANQIKQLEAQRMAEPWH